MLSGKVSYLHRLCCYKTKHNQSYSFKNFHPVVVADGHIESLQVVVLYISKAAAAATPPSRHSRRGVTGCGRTEARKRKE